MEHVEGDVDGADVPLAAEVGDNEDGTGDNPPGTDDDAPGPSDGASCEGGMKKLIGDVRALAEPDPATVVPPDATEYNRRQKDAHTKIVVYVGLYVALCVVMYYLASAYAPALVDELGSAGWMDVWRGSACAHLSMAECKEACQCKICLEAPEDIDKRTTLEWRCVLSDVQCKPHEVAASQGCNYALKNGLR
jgi:hypothetical protein